MKQILKLVFLLVIGQTAFAQAPSNYTNINGRYRWIAGMFDSTFHIPKGSTPSLRTGGSTNSGGLFYNTSDSSVYTYTGTQWIKLRGSINPSDTTNKYVTQVYKKNASDSVFYVKGGNHLFAFIDSVGSPGGGGGGKVYYFNGGVSMGTIGGFQMYELGDTANTGAAANFTRSTTGNIANFITDPNKPGLLQIPAGVWSVDAWLSETGGGANHAEIWVEVEKWDGSTITTIATSPIEQITEGATPNLYSWSVSIPTTSLTVTDRIIIQFYISNTNGKTVTLYTQNGYVGEVHTTFTTGIGAINGLTAPAQYLVTGTSGTDFNINSATATHTFNLPTASATNRGALSTTDWSTFNNKIGGSGTTNYVSKFTGSSTVGNSVMQDDGTNVGIGITPSASIFNQLQVQYAVLMGNSSDATANYLGSNFYLGAGAQWKYIASNQASQLAQTSGGFNWNTAPVGTAGNNLTWTTRMQLTNAGLLGVGTSFIDSNLTVGLGTHLKRGVRMSALPTGVGTKALRIDANGTLSVADTLANPISGTGTTNYIPKFTSSSAIGNSQIFDNGTNVGINTASPVAMLDVNGAGVIRGFLTTTDAIKLGANTSAPTSTDAFIYRPADNTLAFGTASSERMRLTSGGSLGIGTSSPQANLQVLGTIKVATGNAQGILGLGEANGTTVNVGIWRGAANAPTTDGNYLNFGGYDGIVFATGAAAIGSQSERMRLDASGNLGLGTSSPATKLQVIGQSLFTGTNPVLIQRGAGQIGFLLNSPSDNALAFNDWNGTTKMLLDASGNLGLGVTPSAWLSAYKAIQFGIGGALIGRSDDAGIELSSNAYRNSVGSYNYLNTSASTSYRQYLGSHQWFNAPSGTAGNAISFTQAMTLDASGNLLVGTTSSSGQRLQIAGTSLFEVTDAGVGTKTIVATFGRTGAANSGTVREAGIVFRDNAGTTLTGGITGTRDNSGGNYLGGLKFYVNSTAATPSTTFADLTTAMTLTSGGNVGIGTTSPQALLTVAAAGNSQLYIQAGSTALSRLMFGTSTFNNRGFIDYDNTAAVRAMIFRTNENEAMRITSGGNVGIGYTAPTEALAINGNLAVGSTASSGYKLFVNGSAYIAGSTNYIDGLTIFRTAAAAEMARFTSSGELLINTTSDAGDYKLQVNGNTYGNGTAYFTGNMGIGVAPATDVLLYSTKALSGSVAPTGIFLGGLVSATSTTAAAYYITNATTENATFTLPHLYHYRAVQGTFGASSTVTNQYGFSVANSLTSATNNFAFYGDLAAATGRWNLYMNGTANNYLAGETLIATTSDAGDYKLQVAGQIYSNISGAADNNSKFEGNGSFLQIVGRADYATVNIVGGGTNNWDLGIRGETTLRLRENGTTRMSILSGGAAEFSSSIKTAAPSGGTAKPWKFGEAGVSVGGANTTAVKVEIDGVVYYLLTAYLPEPAPESAPKPKPEG